MHFALPTRGNTRSSPFLSNTVSRRYPILRKPLVALVLVIVLLIIIVRSFSGEGTPDAPDAVLVLVLNRTEHSPDYVAKIIENREEYATAHGYGLFIADSHDYPIGPVPDGWARIPAMRHAMTKFPNTQIFWYLDQHAVIMNPSLSLDAHITGPAKLTTLMRRDVPIVPPESVIKTYKHVPAERIQFIISQDKIGMSPGSIIIKSGDWAKYMLDAWYDPMFRFYNFQKAETHALEHIVQWHPTILTKLALVPQKQMNSYSPAAGLDAVDTYADGDFVVHFHGCSRVGRSCDREMELFWHKRGRIGGNA